MYIGLYRAETTHFCSCSSITAWQLCRRAKQPEIWFHGFNGQIQRIVQCCCLRNASCETIPQPKYDRISIHIGLRGLPRQKSCVVSKHSAGLEKEGNHGCKLQLRNASSIRPGIMNLMAVPWAALAQCGSPPLPSQCGSWCLVKGGKCSWVFSVWREVLELWTGKVEYTFKPGN